MKSKLTAIILPIGIVILLNVLANVFFFRWDLTEEKRFSISEATQSMLQNLDDEVYVKVYLAGNELPGGFERLKRAVTETLDDFKTYAGKNINYRFIDPNAITDTKERETVFKELIARGMQPTNIVDNEAGKRTENIIFPYATLSYKNPESGKMLETDVLLLKNNQSLSAQEKLNQSYENVEYELATAIRKLTLKEKKKIGLLTEFTKLQPANFAGLINALQEYYELYILDTKASVTFQGLDAIILPKPDMAIDDSTKLKIDQFIVSGGKALFFVDGLAIDAVGNEGSYAQPLITNLDDMLFKYGLRINKDLIKDGASMAMVPMVVGTVGDQPNIQPIPYRFFPLINNFGNSLITKNLDMVYSRFPSSVDTVQSSGIRKTPLLMTTPYTKTLQAPALVTYNEARSETDTKEYNGGIKVIAYLVEGVFQSLYKNQLLPTDERSKYYPKESVPSKIIVCSDGDLIVNEISPKDGNPLPLGYDKMTKHVFGNMDFVLNAVDYLLDENGVITARSKEVKLRPLDSIKVRDERSFWQFFNLLTPLALVLLLGSVRFWWWRNRYAR